jgi:hypothetical protein
MTRTHDSLAHENVLQRGDDDNSDLMLKRFWNYSFWIPLVYESRSVLYGFSLWSIVAALSPDTRTIGRSSVPCSVVMLPDNAHPNSKIRN